MAKALHEMTKEEIMESMYSFYNPKIVGEINTILVIGLEKEDATLIAYRLRKGAYHKTSYSIQDKEDAESWQETTEEDFRQAFLKDLSTLHMNQLYSKFLTAEWSNMIVRKVEVLEVENAHLMQRLYEESEK